MAAMICKNEKRSGFTIVELLAAMAIFTILVTIVVGAFAQTMRSERLLSQLMTVNNDAGLVLEQIARDIRTGYDFCGGGLSPTLGSGYCDAVAADSISFKDRSNQDVTYSLIGNAIFKGSVPMTAEGVKVTYLKFDITQNSNVCLPPRVTIKIGVTPVQDTALTRVTEVQTTVSSRVLPVEARGASEYVILNCSRMRP
jgi:prepilin-type N-terminal cleavage/methylation domain-containing protein